MNRLIVIAVLVVCCATAAFSVVVNCYQCGGTSSAAGTVGASCGDLFAVAGATKISCASGLCSKSVGGKSIAATYTRDCAVAGTAVGCTTNSQLSVAPTTCICSGNLCNEAGKPAAASSVLIGLTAMFLHF